MNSQLFSDLRSGLLALGVLAGLCMPAVAVPLAGGFSRAAVLPATAGKLTDLQLVGGHRRCRDGRCYRHHGRSQARYKSWNDDYWRSRHYPRRHHHRRHYNVYPGFYLGLGIPTYRYVEPRRYYRRHVGSGCYDRWLTYRAWDNTYQPLYGPRRQCRSPYG